MTAGLDFILILSKLDMILRVAMKACFCFQTPLLCMGEPKESTSKSINRAGFDNNFHGVLDPNIVSQQLLKCIYYNSLMYSSFKGLNL